MSKKLLVLIASTVLGLSSAEFAAARDIIHRTSPVYPEIAKRSNLQGTATLKVTVGADGKVKSVSAVGGNAILNQAAIMAVKQWLFAPGIEETLDIDIAFNLGQ